MGSPEVTNAQVERLHRQARAERWNLSREVFAEALAASAGKAFAGTTPTARAVERYLTSLRLEDLGLACGCATGNDAAWDQFVADHRPVLYRAADALDPSGGAREVADSMYADLYGLQDGEGARQSLFRYFHGRSSLATWLRAVLAQRFIDRVRARRRFEPLPEEDSSNAFASAAAAPDPDRLRYQTLIREALGRSVARLDARDRLRLSCYYAQELTLAQTGRLLREHEATVSRQLARTRRALRENIEHDLRTLARLSAGEIAQCFECVIDDAGPVDLRELLPASGARKASGPDRSK
jgi:RNA polymerase sigma factor (sigma-70 family)